MSFSPVRQNKPLDAPHTHTHTDLSHTHAELVTWSEFSYFNTWNRGEQLKMERKEFCVYFHMRISLDLVTPLVCSQPATDCPAQHYCNIPSFCSDPYTQTHFCTNTPILSVLFLWPMLSQDIRGAKRIDKVLTTPARLVYSKKAARADKMCIFCRTTYKQFMEWSAFNLTCSLVSFLKNSKQHPSIFTTWFMYICLLIFIMLTRWGKKKKVWNGHLFYESDTAIQCFLISSLIGCWISHPLRPACGIDRLPVTVKRALQASE